MNVPYTAAQGSIRFSLGRYNTAEEIDHTLAVLPEIINKLVDMSPYDEKQALEAGGGGKREGGKGGKGRGERETSFSLLAHSRVQVVDKNAVKVRRFPASSAYPFPFALSPLPPFVVFPL